MEKNLANILHDITIDLLLRLGPVDANSFPP